MKKTKKELKMKKNMRKFIQMKEKDMIYPQKNLHLKIKKNHFYQYIMTKNLKNWVKE